MDTDHDLLGVEPLDDTALELVVGGRPKDSGFVCTATTADGGVSEDCWKE